MSFQLGNVAAAVDQINQAFAQLARERDQAQAGGVRAIIDDACIDCRLPPDNLPRLLKVLLMKSKQRIDAGSNDSINFKLTALLETASLAKQAVQSAQAQLQGR